jgi:uncharacterized protein (DUF2236 family)
VNPDRTVSPGPVGRKVDGMAGSSPSGGLSPLSALPARAAPGVPWHAPHAAVAWARGQLALQVSHLLVGDNPPMIDRHGTSFADDPGYFGPDSVTWRLHEDACMVLGGLRALMLQTMHPLAMAGVDQHSDYRVAPLARLANTSVYVGTTLYGTRPQVDAAVAAVKRVHEQIVGVAPDGRPYAANDPHLLTWVHHTLVDSFLRAYRRYGGGSLSAADADRYVAEQAVLADLFDAEPAARSVAELRAWFARERAELDPTPAARRAIRFLLAPPLPLVTRAPYAVVASAAVTMLPRWVRRELWLPVPPAFEPLVVRPAATALVRALGWLVAGYPSERARPTAAGDRIGHPSPHPGEPTRPDG